MTIGDLNSAERGSGARFNDGKVPVELLPLQRVGEALLRLKDNAQSQALVLLGRFQAGEGVEVLQDALNLIASPADAAWVFSYGKSKYAEWNWTKGMPWSVVIACCARHLLKEWAGEELDPESGLPHRGHAACNLLMLLQFAETYREGDDRPVKWLGRAPAAAPRFNALADATRLKAMAGQLTYVLPSEVVPKHTLLEIAMRLETGGYLPAQGATP